MVTPSYVFTRRLQRVRMMLSKLSFEVLCVWMNRLKRSRFSMLSFNDGQPHIGWSLSFRQLITSFPFRFFFVRRKQLLIILIQIFLFQSTTDGLLLLLRRNFSTFGSLFKNSIWVYKLKWNEMSNAFCIEQVIKHSNVVVPQRRCCFVFLLWNESAPHEILMNAFGRIVSANVCLKKETAVNCAYREKLYTTYSKHWAI